MGSLHPGLIHSIPFRGSFQGLCAMTASPGALQLVAFGDNTDALACRTEAESLGDAVLQQGDVIILELHDAITVHADEMIVLGFVEEVGIIKSLVAPQINFTQQFALNEQAQGAVNGGS